MRLHVLIHVCFCADLCRPSTTTPPAATRCTAGGHTLCLTPLIRLTPKLRCTPHTAQSVCYFQETQVAVSCCALFWIHVVPLAWSVIEQWWCVAYHMHFICILSTFVFLISSPVFLFSSRVSLLTRSPRVRCWCKFWGCQIRPKFTIFKYWPTLTDCNNP